MFKGLSLDQAPPYKVPLLYYKTAALYLVGLGFLLACFGANLSHRLGYDTIALTHLLTIGFFSHVMFGSMFQMLPVMLGIAYKNVQIKSNIIYTLLNGGLVLFLAGFLFPMTLLLYGGGILLLGAFLLFSYLSFSVVFESTEKNFLVQNFAMSFAMLFVGSIFGFLALLGHLGYLESTRFGDIHLAVMLFGWIFLLLNSVSYKIIPMFFVAREYPTVMKKWLYLVVTVLLGFFIYFRLLENLLYLHFVQVLMAVVVAAFCTTTIYILKTRKRSRRDNSIEMWYLSMVSGIFASLVFAIDAFYDFSAVFLVGLIVLFGTVYGVINAMLYKIIPFLTWFHLSSLMVFDAEMNNVIKKTDMKRQTKLYYIAFGFFALGGFVKFFIAIGGVVFVLSSVLLLRNILYAQAYYKEFSKKGVNVTV